MHAALTLTLALFAVVPDDAGPKPGSVPIVYSTDLYHPHEDPDDHFDLATLYALGQFDIRGVILDGGARQLKAPGRVPVEQMIELTGRKTPCAIGLGASFGSPEDDARKQPEELQGGVKLLLDALRASPGPVTVFTTGSVRDVAAAFNREPELLRKKIGRLYINIGDASGWIEYNVGLDRHSYVRVLRSGLPVYWCPCFDGGGGKKERGYATYWQFTQSQVLDAAPVGLQNWFIFALTKPAADPIAFLSQPQKEDGRKRVWAMRRNMWCTAPFLHAAGLTVVQAAPDRWEVRPQAAVGDAKRLFDFLPAKVAVEPSGKAALVLDQQAPGEPVLVFKILDPAAYDAAMTKVLRELYAKMPLDSSLPDGRQ